MILKNDRNAHLSEQSLMFIHSNSVEVVCNVCFKKKPGETTVVIQYYSTVEDGQKKKEIQIASTAFRRTDCFL